MTDQPQTDTVERKFFEMNVPYTSYCVMCESYENADDGTVTLGRIFDRWGLANATPPFRVTFNIAIGFGGLRPGEDERFGIYIIRESDHMVVLHQEPVLRSPKPTLNYFIEVPAFTILEFGRYRMSVIRGDHEIGRFSFVAEQDAPAAHVTPGMLV